MLEKEQIEQIAMIIFIIMFIVFIILVIGWVICYFFDITGSIEYIKDVKRKKKMGYHSISKSNLPVPTKDYLLHIGYKFIEEYTIPYLFNFDNYQNLKILKKYCDENNIKCKLPVLIDDVIDNHIILEWLKNNEIYTESQLKESKLSKLSKPDFSFDEFLSCKYSEIRHCFYPKWYVDYSKLEELENLLLGEVINNNYIILSCNVDYKASLIICDFQFKNINDNVIKYRKLQKEVNDLIVKLCAFYFNNKDIVITDYVDFRYLIYEKWMYEEMKEHYDFLQIPITEEYDGKLVDIGIDINSKIRVDLLKVCNDFYSKNTNRSLLLDTIDFISVPIQLILTELNRKADKKIEQISF